MTKSKNDPKKMEKKAPDRSGPEQVAEYLDRLEHPLKDEIMAVRTIVLGAHEHLTEHWKWNAPSFCYNNEDRVTFQLHGNGFFRLVFHCGAKKTERTEKGRLFEDETGLLDWVADDRAIVKFAGMHDVEANKEKLAEVVSKWIEATG